MNKRSAAFLLLFLAAAAADFCQTWQTGSLEEALAVAKKEKKLLLIDLYSSSG